MPRGVYDHWKLKGKNSHFYGKCPSEETKRKIILTIKLQREGKTYEEIYGKERAKEISMRITEARKRNGSYEFAKEFSKEKLEEMRKKGFGFREGHIPWNKGLTKESDERMRNCSERMIINNPAKKPEVKERMSESATRKLEKLWQDPEYRKKTIRNAIRSNQIKPNKKESFLDSILQENFPDEFMYSGDGKVVFPCGCPDFWNIDGQKKVILLHGIYWHLWRLQSRMPSLTKEIVERHDIENYKKYGIDCLIVWEDELDNEEKVLEKIKRFV